MGFCWINKMLLMLYFVAILGLFINPCFGDDPSQHFYFTYSYKTLSPLGIPQQVIVVNDQFPGPLIEVTTNVNVFVHVKNKLDEELLINWNGLHLQDDPWQDGVQGTTCAIPPKWNFTYQFQAKDQIGSFFYHPTTKFQRASGGFGPIILNNRTIIPLPFPKPDANVILVIGDWYNRDHKALRADLDSGRELGLPDGVLINGNGPFQYNTTLVPDGIDYNTVKVEPGRTYRFRVHNVGISTSLNFRIQNHTLNLVETEGYYTSQANYSSMDIHVGQSYSFLVTMDQDASTDYYIVASARFINESGWERVTGVAILQYTNSRGKATGPLPDPPNDSFDRTWSLNQALSVRQNGSASGARPNPQGSFHYGSINVTDTYILQTLPPATIKGKRRATLNGISFVNPSTPILIADFKNVKGAYKRDFPGVPMAGRAPRMDTSVIDGTFKGFAEIVFQNNDTVMQSFHLDGFSFYVVGMGLGVWSNDNRGSYNKWDAIYRCTVQVFPGGWTAVYAYLDNPGVWNIRTENLDRWYLGQETYIRLVNSEDKNSLFAAPDNVMYCGSLAGLQPKQNSATLTNKNIKFLGALLILLVVLIDLF
ncbi:monocopper oxidase-like protein SKS1 [Silene latifolia]|uniref:monocopper oxidase-like protein SKS1 n=1 Tax=Silene latifolia TaxID=37657 RepID=UPI003D781318